MRQYQRLQLRLASNPLPDSLAATQARNTIELWETNMIVAGASTNRVPVA